MEQKQQQPRTVFSTVLVVLEVLLPLPALPGTKHHSRNSLLYISKDGGATWSLEPTGNSPGTFAAVSCVGIGDSLVCSAAGNITPSPLIYQSLNNGSSWNIIDLPSKAGTFSSISCTGSGMDAVCAAAGIDNKEMYLYCI